VREHNAMLGGACHQNVIDAQWHYEACEGR
jgi:hypothetical protein